MGHRGSMKKAVLHGCELLQDHQRAHEEGRRIPPFFKRPLALHRAE
jgi:hypothetical protein